MDLVRNFERLVQRGWMKFQLWLAVQHPKLHHRLFGSPSKEPRGEVLTFPTRQNMRQVGLQKKPVDWLLVVVAVSLSAALILVPLLLRPHPFA